MEAEVESTKLAESAVFATLPPPEAEVEFTLPSP
jgi:hypothetical protein